MAEDIKSLIEKINEEGIKQAEEKAKVIEQEAKAKAQQIIEEAKHKAADMVTEAQNKIRQMSVKEDTLRQQAARDLLLFLRKEISAMMQRSIIKEAQQALRPEKLAEIIAELIKGAQHQTKPEVVITLRKEDLAFLEKHLFSRLSEEVKRGVTLRPTEEFAAGFTISFDSGKSEFEFTDKAIADYIGNYLKPKLKTILDEATK